MGPPLPLTPIDLLAGLGPHVELLADDLPPGVATDSPGREATPAMTTVEPSPRFGFVSAITLYDVRTSAS